MFWDVQFEPGYEDISPECIQIEVNDYLTRKPLNAGKFITAPDEVYEEIRKINSSINKRYLNNKKLL